MYNTVISACLLGIPCRFNGKGKPKEEAIKEFLKGQAIPICPEIVAGEKTPRSACEIVGGDGFDVINGKAKVKGKDGNDYTDSYLNGAKIVMNELVKGKNIKKAILKKGSPSCGCGCIFDGTFSDKEKEGCGVFTAMILKYNKDIETKEL